MRRGGRHLQMGNPRRFTRPLPCMCIYNSYPRSTIFRQQKRSVSADLRNLYLGPIHPNVCRILGPCRFGGCKRLDRVGPVETKYRRCPERECNLLRSDNEITNSYELISPPSKFLKRGASPFRLPQARYGHEGLVSFDKIPFLFELLPRGDGTPFGG